MFKQKDIYSLWLRPTQSQIDELTKIISKLAHRYRTTPFPPHITLRSSINADLENIKQACKIILTQYLCFDITLSEIDYSDSYFRNLYIHANLDSTLAKLYQDSKELLNCENNEVFMPHVSLLYGKLKETQQQALQKELSKSYPKIFNCQRLDIYNTTGSESQWYLVESFNLRFSE